MAVEQLEAAVMVERMVVSTLAAGGATDLEWPTVQRAREEYDAYLLAEPTRMTPADSERLHLHRALGVA